MFVILLMVGLQRYNALFGAVTLQPSIWDLWWYSHSADITTAIAIKISSIANKFIMFFELSFQNELALPIVFDFGFNSSKFIFSKGFNDSSIFFYVISGDILIMGSYYSVQLFGFISINFLNDFSVSKFSSAWWYGEDCWTLQIHYILQVILLMGNIVLVVFPSHTFDNSASFWLSFTYFR